jgi:SPASM domain peptide maturase of grasp-with-spasm system
LKTKNKYYKLFADCFPVKGYSRSVIYDVTRKKFDFIPNSLYEIIIEGVIDVSKYHNSLNDDLKDIFNEYIHFLLKEEYVFEISDISDKDNYPDIDLKFDYPAKISNAIIDFNGNYGLFIESISQLEQLNCNFIVIRFLKQINITEFEKILSIFNDSVIFSIDIIVDFNADFTEENVLNTIVKYPRINIISIFKSPTDSFNNSILNNGMGQVVFIKKKYNRNEILKIKGENYFIVNLKIFSESFSYNNFFHKKVYISEIGEVKNSPFGEIVFGSIKKSSLEDIVNNKDFRKIWNVKKDLIDVCKDCEFRYMCVDNRNPIQRNAYEWYFVDDCHYNPYVNRWNVNESVWALIKESKA